MSAEALIAAVRAWASTPRASVAEDDATSELLNALVAYDAPRERELQGITTQRDDDRIAVVRYVTRDVDDDTEHGVITQVTVYVGDHDDILTAIQHDSEGSDEVIVEDVMLLWADVDAAELGFASDSPPKHGVFVLGDDKIIP